MTDPSWRVKLLRAEHHFGYFKMQIIDLLPQVYPVSKSFEPYDGVEQWVWSLAIPHVADPTLAVLVGDVLFNVRSALDHLAVALVAPERRTRRVLRRTAFPIFTCDIDERDPITNQHLHVQQRSIWDRTTQGFAPETLNAIKWHQPYNYFSQDRDPRDSSLAILGSLQNADKHRQLVVTIHGIRDPVGIYTHLVTGQVQRHVFPPVPDGFLADGTALDYDPADIYADVKMEVEGTPEVFLGDGGLGPYREATSALRLIIDNAWFCVERLEALVVE